MVEWAALEMRCTGDGTGGSNPSSSASARRSFMRRRAFFFVFTHIVSIPPDGRLRRTASAFFILKKEAGCEGLTGPATGFFLEFLIHGFFLECLFTKIFLLSIAQLPHLHPQRFNLLSNIIFIRLGH